VHNYGHAGYGYQVSYACAGDVIKLVEEIVDEKEGRDARIKATSYA
jgi:hypothetical protein